MKTNQKLAILFCAAALLSGGIPLPASAGLVAHYTFDNTVADTTGNHNGTLIGTANYVSGVAGQALEFDGVTNFITLANPDSIPFSGDFTISAWIQTTEASQEAIFAKVPGTEVWAAPGKQFLMREDGLYNDAYGVSSFQADTYDAWGIQPNDGSWHHVACVYSSLTTPSFIWYIDGNPVVDSSNWLESFDTTNMIALIGQRGSGVDFYSGAIDDMQIYDQPLSQTQVSYLLNNPGSTITPDPVITTAPQSQNAPQGTNVTFSVTGTGSGALSYQWYYNTTNIIAGATSDSLTLTDVTTNESGCYSVLATDDVGSISKTAKLVVYLPPVFTAITAPGLTIQGTIGMTYKISEAPALTGTNSWNALTNVTLSNSPSVWFDVQSATTSNGFYQAIPSP